VPYSALKLQNSKTAYFYLRLLAHEIIDHGGRYNIAQGQLLSNN